MPSPYLNLKALLKQQSMSESTKIKQAILKMILCTVFLPSKTENK